MGEPEGEENKIVLLLGSPIEYVCLYVLHTGIRDPFPIDLDHLGRNVNGGHCLADPHKLLRPITGPGCQLKDVPKRPQR